MNNLDRSLNNYYRQVRSWLPCSRKMKSALLSRLQDSVLAYREANPAANFSQIQAHFGTPETIASAYVEEMGIDILLRDLRIRRRIVAIVAGSMAIILALWLAVVGWAIIREINSSGAEIESNITYMSK